MEAVGHQFTKCIGELIPRKQKYCNVEKTVFQEQRKKKLNLGHIFCIRFWLR